MTPHAHSAAPLVLKFGGAALASPARIRRAVARIRFHLSNGDAVVVVASAAGRTTDRILHRLEAVGAGGREGEGAHPPSPTSRALRRERNRALLSGEDRSSALLAAALLAAGVPARSLEAGAAGIRGRPGRLPTLDPGPVLHLLTRGIVPVVGGFQAAAPRGGRITLERGGSDLVAVLLAARLRASALLLVKDVHGVHPRDPALDPGSPLLPSLSWEALETLALNGARVLQAEAARQARRHRIPLDFVHMDAPPGAPPGTRVGEGASTEGRFEGSASRETRESAGSPHGGRAADDIHPNARPDASVRSSVEAIHP
jgi:aspartate kinase